LELAEFMKADDAIVFSSGFICNVATISALVGPGDVVIGDERNHASIRDGCTFSAATFKAFRHNDLQELESLLHLHAGRRMLVVVDAVYSMDGDIAPIPRIASLCRTYGALLMVDEAHSLGVIGRNGRGVQEHFDLADDAIDIKMGTLSKTIASSGGFVAARREIIEFLKHSARGFIFSGSLPAPQVAAARKSLEILCREPGRTVRLAELARQLAAGLRDLGFKVPHTESAIVPIVFDSESATMEAVRFCRHHNLFVVPVFYPAVPADAPRIRATVISTFTDDDIGDVLAVFEKLARRLSIVGQLA
jgi:glycine C-acetyltransferase